MNISIVDNDPVSKYVTSSGVVITEYKAVYYKSALVWVLIGGFALVLDLLDFDGGSTVTIGKKTTFVNWHLGLGFGIAFIWVGISVLIQMNKQIQRSKNLRYDILKNHFELSNSETMVITDESIRIESSVGESTTKWRVITGYLERGDLLFLIKDFDGHGSFVIDKRKLSAEGLVELLSFLKQNKQISKSIINRI